MDNIVVVALYTFILRLLTVHQVSLMWIVLKSSSPEQVMAASATTASVPLATTLSMLQITILVVKCAITARVDISHQYIVSSVQCLQVLIVSADKVI
jgi:hypothetical protein